MDISHISSSWSTPAARTCASFESFFNRTKQYYIHKLSIKKSLRKKPNECTKICSFKPKCHTGYTHVDDEKYAIVYYYNDEIFGAIPIPNNAKKEEYICQRSQGWENDLKKYEIGKCHESERSIFWAQESIPIFPNTLHNSIAPPKSLLHEAIDSLRYLGYREGIRSIHHSVP